MPSRGSCDIDLFLKLQDFIHHEKHQRHEVSAIKYRFVCLSSVRDLRVSFAHTYALTIWATEWHEASVIPAKAGIHPLTPLDAGLRRHDESRKQPWGGGRAAISYSVDQRKLMNASW
jgi:hypothetical protein